MLVTGTCGIPVYTCSLTLYYVCKLVYGMSDRSFAKKLERYIHIGFVVFSLIMGIAALWTDSLNTSALASFCYYAAHPTGCKSQVQSPTYGKCTRGLYSHVFMFIGGLGVPLLCFGGVVTCMIVLFSHAVKKTRLYRRMLVVQQEEQNHGGGTTTTTPAQPEETEADLISRIYMRETAIQASLYVTCFMVVYVVPFCALIYTVSGNVASLVQNAAIQTIMFIFFPLGGFFNIAIYCRPKVVALRSRETDISWIKAYMVVIRGGGEIPPQVESMSSPLWRRHWVSNTQKDEEEEEEEARRGERSHDCDGKNLSLQNVRDDSSEIRLSSLHPMEEEEEEGGGSLLYSASNIGVDGMSSCWNSSSSVSVGIGIGISSSSSSSDSSNKEITNPATNICHSNDE